MTSPSEYFERKRGYWNFVASLVVGIVAGSLFSVTIEHVLGSALPTPYDLYVPLGVIPIVGVVLVYVAIKFSAGLETTTKVYQFIVGPDSFSAIIHPALMELQRHNDSEAKELEEKLTSFLSILGSKTGLRAANLQTLRAFHKDLVGKNIFWRNKDAIVAGMLSKLIEMLGNLEATPGTTSKVCQEKMKLIFKDAGFRFSLSEKKDVIRINAKKGRWFWSRVIFRLDFRSSIENSLLVPSNCTLTAYPLGNYMEHRKFEENIDHVLESVQSEKGFRELGIEFVELEKGEYWESMRETVANPLLKQVRSMEEKVLDQLEDVTSSLIKQIRTTDEKVDKLNQARTKS